MQVNVGLLVFSLLGFALPLYLYIVQKRMGDKDEMKEDYKSKQELASEEEDDTSDDDDMLVSRGALVF